MEFANISHSCFQNATTGDTMGSRDHLKPRKCGGKLQRGTLRWATFVWVAGGETSRLEFCWVFRCQTRGVSAFGPPRSFKHCQLYREKPPWNFRIHFSPNSHYSLFGEKIHGKSPRHPTIHRSLGCSWWLATPSAIGSFHHPSFPAQLQALLEKALQGEALGPRHFPGGIFCA